MQAEITGGSEDGDQRSDRQAQQGAATDARAICDHVPEIHRAARGEMPARLQLQFVPDVEAADRDHEWIGGGQPGADHNATDQPTPERQDEGAPRPFRETLPSRELESGPPRSGEHSKMQRSPRTVHPVQVGGAGCAKYYH